MEKKLLSRYSH